MEAPEASLLTARFPLRKRWFYLKLLQRTAPNRYFHTGPTPGSPFILGISWNCGAWPLRLRIDKYTRTAYQFHYFICRLYNLKFQEILVLLAFFLISEWKNFYSHKSTSKISNRVNRRYLQRGPFLCTYDWALRMTCAINT